MEEKRVAGHPASPALSGAASMRTAQKWRLVRVTVAMFLMLVLTGMLLWEAKGVGRTVIGLMVATLGVYTMGEAAYYVHEMTKLRNLHRQYRKEKAAHEHRMDGLSPTDKYDPRSNLMHNPLSLEEDRRRIAELEYRIAQLEAMTPDTTYGDLEGGTAVGIGVPLGEPPAAPTITFTSPGRPGQVDVAFTEPISPGGSAITSFTVVSEPGMVEACGTSSPITVKGLMPGDLYTFTVFATNSSGDGAPSPPSEQVPAGERTKGLPGAPEVTFCAPAGVGSVEVAFRAPDEDGGDRIVGYSVTALPGEFQINGLESPIQVDGLDPGQVYTFTVSAANSQGTGPPSEESMPCAAGSPPTKPPGAPTITRCDPDEGAVVVAVDPPWDDGGSPITSYLVMATPTPAEQAKGTPPISQSGASTPIIVQGLEVGGVYTFTAYAINIRGEGPPSAESQAVAAESEDGRLRRLHDEPAALTEPQQAAKAWRKKKLAMPDGIEDWIDAYFSVHDEHLPKDAAALIEFCAAVTPDHELSEEEVARYLKEYKQRKKKAMHSGPPLKPREWLENYYKQNGYDKLPTREQLMVFSNHQVSFAQAGKVLKESKAKIGKKTGHKKKIKCAVCGTAVFDDDKIAALGAFYHETCFRCESCQEKLTLDTFKEKKNKAYCSKCFDKKTARSAKHKHKKDILAGPPPDI